MSNLCAGRRQYIAFCLHGFDIFMTQTLIVRCIGTMYFYAMHDEVLIKRTLYERGFSLENGRNIFMYTI